MRKNLNRGISQACAESLELGGPQALVPQPALGSSLTWELPGHVAPRVIADDRSLSGKALAT